ncbi:MAG: DUF2796 domain-containing protein [Proteobacteria bacterium]|nr:DUF2796 domain-containing protein [Burkholderiales bacterium]
MRRFTSLQQWPCRMVLASALAGSSAALAQGAHVHGLVRLDVAVDVKTLTVKLQAPLDSLLGFEHRPRTPAQKTAAGAVLERINDVSALVRPEAAAMCMASQTNVESETLQSSKPAGGKEAAHAELEATYQFTCAQPDKLTFIEFGFFDAFKRIQRIDVQVVGGKGQFKQTLKRPDKTLKLRR